MTVRRILHNKRLLPAAERRSRSEALALRLAYRVTMLARAVESQDVRVNLREKVDLRYVFIHRTRDARGQTGPVRPGTGGLMMLREGVVSAVALLAATSCVNTDRAGDRLLIADSAGAQLMRQRRVDIVITGADRIAANGDTANKIGTYSHALAARANGIPFYIAAPLTTFDRETADGESIPIEERTGDEIVFVDGLTEEGEMVRVRVPPLETQVINPAFDVTPAALITGIITEVGVVPATRDGITDAFRRPRPSQSPV